MDRTILPAVIGFALLAIVLALFLPGGRAPDPNPKLPWKIKIDQDRKTHVFGLTLDETPLEEIQASFGAAPKINLFVSPEGEYAVEAYFERLFLSGIKADLVMKLAVTQQEADAMYQRGLRVSKLGSGNQKVDLSAPDLASAQQLPVSHIAYLPATDLDPERIRSLFGEPSRHISINQNITHWLYPEKGLDIALNSEGDEIFQYVPPDRFELLLTPLEETQD